MILYTPNNKIMTDGAGNIRLNAKDWCCPSCHGDANICAFICNPGQIAYYNSANVLSVQTPLYANGCYWYNSYFNSTYQWNEEVRIYCASGQWYYEYNGGQTGWVIAATSGATNCGPAQCP